MDPETVTMTLLCSWCDKQFTLVTSTGSSSICLPCSAKAAARILDTERHLAELKGLDEAGRICWLLGISREKFEELGGLG